MQQFVKADKVQKVRDVTVLVGVAFKAITLDKGAEVETRQGTVVAAPGSVVVWVGGSDRPDVISGELFAALTGGAP